MDTSSTSPAISVIIPVYKVEKFLAECIESVLAQTFTDFEMILVDDGSPDNSGKICDDFAARDSRIRVFHKENGGVSSARNLGISRARAEHVAFLDSDDIWSPHYLSACNLLIERFPSVGIYGCAWTHEQKKLSANISPDNCNVLKVFEYLKTSNKRGFMFPFYTSSIVVERKKLSDSAFDESLAVGEDYDVWLKLLMLTGGAIGYCSQATVFYREVPAVEKPRGLLPPLAHHYASKCEEQFQKLRKNGLGWWCDRYLAGSLSFYWGSRVDEKIVKRLVSAIDFSNINMKSRIFFSLPPRMAHLIRKLYVFLKEKGH